MADERSSATVAPARLLADRYRLHERVAVGGMAEVWGARDEVLQRPVAVKVLKPALLGNPVTVERFRREAVAGARLSHVNLVGVFDTISEPGLEAIVMELVDGPSLRQRLDQVGALDPSEVVAIARQVLSGLEVAHLHGVIHRDIKPGNILLASDGRILLGDFGIAKGAEPDVVDLTSDNIMIGTAKYLAPEQVTGAPVDARSDLYSLGVVLYECLAGEVPFDAGSDAATALARLHQPPRPIAWIRRDLPIGLADLIDRCLRREPEGRPDTAREATAILKVAGAVPVHDPTRDLPRDPTPRDPSRRELSSTSAPPRQGTRPPGTARIPGSRPPGAPADRASRGIHVVIPAFMALSVIVALVLFGNSSTGLRLFRSGIGRSPAVTTPSGDNGAAAKTIAITSVLTFDPYGDGRERNAALAALTDGDPTTAWTTETYRARDLAGKPGVGLIIELAQDPTDATLEVTTAGTDWTARLFRSSSPQAALSDWGQPLSEARAANGPMTFGAKGQGRYLLLWITDPGTSAPQYRLAIQELRARG